MSDAKLMQVLCDISNMCVGDVAMGYKLDAQTVGEMICNATGMNNEQLNEFCKQKTIFKCQVNGIVAYSGKYAGLCGEYGVNGKCASKRDCRYKAEEKK